ncbi:MAG: lipase [Sphingomonas bacterium]|uniref:GDSL-type esterase/lipase family protein n=1 Tax=Sphingomonas bacterium TaxID=1895847 RepID=UPI00261BAC77|nr:GDSL-type esterase/lipase family protein [Sphingomonas bacterium]MDB5703604.1 lipase [Sphingomonas bacterium]
MKAALLTLAALSAPVTAATCTGPVCDLDALDPWFAKLAHAREGGAPVHILQIGDSHTAGDAITGAWRDLLQARDGNGGRGVLPPGRPYDGYITRGVTVAMSPGWAIGATFGKGALAPRPLLGLSGFSMTAMKAGASMALSATPAMAFDRFTLCAIGGPGAGVVTVRFDTADLDRLDFSAPTVRPICLTIRSATPRSAVAIAAEQASLTITSWATFRDTGGVTLSNLGVVGSQLAHFARTDDAVVAAELDAYKPDLIVLAFGTNEGFAPHFDPVAFEAVLRSQITRLRLLSGGTPMLLLGAPDALSRQEPLRTNAPGAVIGCEPAGDRPALFAPPALTAVRAIQRRVAGELGLAFWDWQARMGGPCAARSWVQREAPLMRGDYVHFTTAGGTEIARRVQADLDQGAAAAE